MTVASHGGTVNWMRRLTTYYKNEQETLGLRHTLVPLSFSVGSMCRSADVVAFLVRAQLDVRAGKGDLFVWCHDLLLICLLKRETPSSRMMP